MAFEEIHTMRDAALGLIAISNLFLSQPIPVNDEMISVIEEYMKNTKMENVRKAHFEINNAVDSEICCSDKKALNRVG